MDKIFNVLYDKESFEVYYKFQAIESSIENSDEIYQYFDKIKDMLLSDKSYIRVRGFRIICKLAKWDKENKINNIINLLLDELDDDKPTAVRQCLKALDYLLIYKQELFNTIKKKLKSIDINKYKDTMSPLIKKDIENILNKKVK